MAVSPVPEGYHTVTPYLVVKNAVALLEFMKGAFGATEVYLMKGPGGEVRHADMLIGNSHIMVGESNGPWTPMPSTLYLYLPDCDAAYKSAVAAGGGSVQEPQTQFYGDRHGAVRDVCGNVWWLATHVEDVAPEEINRRAAAAANQRQG